MCGIVYAHNRAGQPVNIEVMQQFDNQRHRGVEGFGLFDGQEKNMVRHSKEDGILKWLDRYPSDMILFHHRFPTSTVNVKRAAHPFSTKNYFKGVQYILVHNGSIRNADELFCDHQELGIEYQSLLEDLTFNDSEALLWDFALTMQGKQKEMKAHGPMAFVCMKLVKGKIERLYFARNTNPLNLHRDKQNISLSSEGAGEAIDPDVLYNYHYESNRLTKRKFDVPSYKPYKYTGEFAGGRSTGKFQGGTGYTPGSYADRHAGRRAAESYPSIHNCNCGEVGWENCEYHSFFSESGTPDDGFDHVRDEISNGEDDDSAAYEAWWGNRTPKSGQPGDWLPPKLRRKFRGLLDAASKSKNKGAPPVNREADYEYDPKTQLMLPVGAKEPAQPFGKEIPEEVIADISQTGDSLESALARHEDRKTAEQQLLVQTQQIPSEEEVEQAFLAYLAGARGHFESAYWAIEDDYQRAEDAPDTEDNIRRRYLLEKLMERFQNDPDYKDDTSVSPIWEEIRWDNPQMA